METERRVERPSEILGPLWAAEEARFLQDCDFEQPTPRETIAYRDAVFAFWDKHAARLDALESSQLRADKLLIGIAEHIVAYPCANHAVVNHAKEWLAAIPPPESQSQTAVSEWPKWFKAWDTYILRVDANGAFMWGRHCTTVSELTLDSHEVRAAMIGQENWSPSIHEEAIRLVPLVAAKYPIASPPAKAVEPASETAENIAGRMAKTLDEWMTKTGNRESFNIQKWIRDALTTYAASERDALKLRAEELAKELAEANHMLACNRREVTRLSEAAQTNHADRRELAKMNASLHGKLMRINDALMNPPLVTPPEPTNAS